jgi:hypothetical protein
MRTDHQRIAANESAFRRVNEGIERGRTPVSAESTAAFVCECARLGCTEVLDLTIAEYELVRAHPRRFVIAPGHEVEGERVVGAHDGFSVVEKLGEAGRVAEMRDPRR